MSGLADQAQGRNLAGVEGSRGYSVHVQNMPKVVNVV